MSAAKFITASDAMESWRYGIESGERPRFFPVGIGELASMEVRPRTIGLLGAPPAGGKTALVMQCGTTALQLTPSLKCVVCNVEMSPESLLDRQLARFSGIDLDTIRNRQFNESHSERLDIAFNTMETFIDRLCFVSPPFDLGNVAATVDEFMDGESNDLLLILDYIQRIHPPGEHADKRGSVDACMSYLRQFADAGAAVIVVSAVGRQKDARGRSSYDGDALNLASFRESSELEFGCDNAYIITQEPDSDIRVLRHLKARNTEQRDIVLTFDGAHQRFIETDAAEMASKAELKKEIDDLWDITLAASDCEE